MIINAEQNRMQLDRSVNNIFKKEFHEHGIVTSVMIINASNDTSNIRYINQKKKILDEFGVRCFVKHFDESCREEDIITYIEKNQKRFNGVMIQTPIYKHLDYEHLIEVVDYRKDIDGLHPTNQGLLYSQMQNAIVPCTAVGVIQIMMNNYIDYYKKNVVIIGRGKLVADPLAKLLEFNDCTVTKIHTKTDPEFSKYLIKNADIIISCAGRDLSNLINPNTVGENLKALIGVGFRYENGKQLQDFSLDMEWDPDICITSHTKATGSATVYALVDNLVKMRAMNSHNTEE